MRLITLMIFVSLSVFAVTPERPESNLDLRGGSIILSIERVKTKENLYLERTGSGDYFLVYVHKEKMNKMKLARPEAELLDQKFTSTFLKIQYELPQDVGGCKFDWNLSMRGERESICVKSEQKNQEIEPIFSDLKKNLNT
jgi:hypothetical protein